LVPELIAAREQDGASKTYVSQLKTILNRFATAFPGEILGISSSGIDAWLGGLPVSASSRNSMLICVKVLFSYARAQNCLPAEQMTAPEQIKKVKIKHDDVSVFTPEEMKKLLHASPPRLIPYRIAVVKSADQVALEAGNSPTIIFKHYHELATDDEAAAWFNILPKASQWENTFEWDRRARIVTLADSDES
jgi:hypothetical protein